MTSKATLGKDALMNLTRTSLAILIIVLCFSFAMGQRRRTPPPPKPVATPTPAPQPTPAQPADPSSPAIAIVNETTISATDIQDEVIAVVMRDSDPYLRDYYTDPAKAIREARQRAVDARVGSLLVAAEAKKRGKDSNDLIQAEIDARIPAPTEDEIKAAYDANRDQIGSADLESVRSELINYLREKRRQDLYATMITRLKMTNVVSKGADVNAANLASGTVLASINGEPLRVDAINERMKAYVYKLEMRLFEIRKRALDRRINDLLIVAEANKKKVGPEEIVRTEITEKLKTPTEAEVSKFYEDNKAGIRGDLASTRADVTLMVGLAKGEKMDFIVQKATELGVGHIVPIVTDRAVVRNWRTGTMPWPICSAIWAGSMTRNRTTGRPATCTKSWPPTFPPSPCTAGAASPRRGGAPGSTGEPAVNCGTPSSWACPCREPVARPVVLAG